MSERLWEKQKIPTTFRSGVLAISHSGFLAGGLTWLCLLLSMVTFSRAFPVLSICSFPLTFLSLRPKHLKHVTFNGYPWTCYFIANLWSQLFPPLSVVRWENLVVPLQSSCFSLSYQPPGPVGTVYDLMLGSITAQSLFLMPKYLFWMIYARFFVVCFQLCILIVHVSACTISSCNII